MKLKALPFKLNDQITRSRGENETMAVLLQKAKVGSLKQPLLQIQVPPPNQNGKFWDIQTHGVTQGFLGLLASCPQKAAYKFKEGMGADMNSSAIQFGDIFHRTLDGVYSAMKDTHALQSDAEWDKFLSGFDTLLGGELNKIYESGKKKLKVNLDDVSNHMKWEMNSGMARSLVTGYFKQWNKDYSDYEWLDLERPFCETYELVTAIDGSYSVSIPVRGKFDGVFRTKDGLLWLFETKTKSRIDDGHIADKLNFDLQTFLYLWAVEKVYGETPAGVMYNVARRPGLKQTVKETLPQFIERVAEDIEKRPEFYFMRFNASITKDEIRTWEKNDLHGLMNMAWDWSNGEFNYRNSGNCLMFMRPCEYIRTCAYNDRKYLTPREYVYPELMPDINPEIGDD